MTGVIFGDFKEGTMQTYSRQMEKQMRHFYRSLSEKDRRRYAAVETAKFGYGGLAYISELLGCDCDTIRQGRQDVEQLPDDEAEGRIRKKGRPEVS
jgi:hypothetical protein